MKKRLLEFLAYLGIGQTKFEERTGLSRGYINKLKGDMKFDTINKVISAYPELNKEWLISGDGEMLKEEESQNTITKIHKPTKYMEKVFESQEITLYDIRAAANLKTLFTEKNQNILGKITLPDIPKCDGALYVTGDSMDPIIKSGDIVCYKEIHDFNNVVYGQMYLVAMNIEGEEYLTIKYITRSDNGNKWICLKSHNPLHSPQDFELKYINALALIVISIRRHI